MRVSTAVDSGLDDQLTDRLVEFNKLHAEPVRRRFLPGNLAAEPVHAFGLGDDAALVGGCVGRVERIWHWLTVDTMWVRDDLRGSGLGTRLLESVEDQARSMGCRWAEVTTFDFQAPWFYERRGYVQYAVKVDYPPGHANHLFRKDL